MACRAFIAVPLIFVSVVLARPVRAADEDPVAGAITRIVAEARASWDARSNWPVRLSESAQAAVSAVPDAARLAAMADRLHENPAVDAYLRDVFLPDQIEITDANRQQVHGMLSVMPQLIGAPRPVLRTGGTPTTGRAALPNAEGYGWIFIGTQQAYVRDLEPVVANGVVAYKPVIGVLSTGTLLEVNGVATAGSKVMLGIRRTSADLVRMRNFVVTANQPNDRFRRRLVAALPPGAERMDAMLSNVDDRLRANDEAYAPAMEAFVAEARRMSASTGLNKAVRTALIAKLDRMSRYQDTQIRRIEIKGSNQYQVHRDNVALDPERVAAATAYLRGEQPDLVRAER